MKDRHRRFAAAANAALAELGAEPSAGQFVCPVCLHLRPNEQATAAHYPAQTMPGQRVTTLACRACNALMGRTYEPAGVDALRGIRTITWGFDTRGQIMARGTFERDGRQVTLRMGRPLDRRPRRRRGKFPETLSAVRAHARGPNVAHMEIYQVDADSVQRTLLAWSLLTWSHYARYAYTASPGAERVRRLILMPDTPLPTGLGVVYGPLTAPLRPDPIVVVRTSVAPIKAIEDIEELVGLGVEWGNGFVVRTDSGTDTIGRSWRVAALLWDFTDPPARVGASAYSARLDS